MAQRGRPRKYHNDEDRREAIRASKRVYAKRHAYEARHNALMGEFIALIREDVPLDSPAWTILKGKWITSSAQGLSRVPDPEVREVLAQVYNFVI